MTPPLVDQLRFAGLEFVRSLAGIDEADARHRPESMNCLSWMVGHLADREQRYRPELQGQPPVVTGLNALVGFGKPASTPPLAEMWEAWRAVIAAADPYSDRLNVSDLPRYPLVDRPAAPESIGTMPLRVIERYWFHTGESQTARQLLGHRAVPDVGGDIGLAAPYRPERSS